MKAQQGFAYRLSDEPAHLGFLVKLHFAFRRMDVDVHGRGVELEKEAAHGVTAFHEGGVIALEQGEIQATVLDGPAVYEEVLVLARGPRHPGRADESPDAEFGFREAERGILGRLAQLVGFRGFGQFDGEIDGQQFLIAAVHRAQAFAQRRQAGFDVFLRGYGGQLPGEPAVPGKCEGDLRVRQRGQREVMLDVGGLGFFRAQELAARGQVEEELAHFDAGARGGPGGADFKDFAAVDDDLRGLGRSGIAFARGQGKPADAGDAREGFASEAHGGDGGEVLGALDFAGGVPLEAEQGVVAAHAQAIVRHADEAASAGLDFDGEAARAGVEGIFDEFLDDAGRTLDHFARGDLVGHVLGE